jgi:hypothetical protein
MGMLLESPVCLWVLPSVLLSVPVFLSAAVYRWVWKLDQLCWWVLRLDDLLQWQFR